MAVRCNSERGRTEYLLVGLVPGPDGLAAYPMGKGSGSVTTFSRADGFLVIPRQQEYVDRGERGEDHAAGPGDRAGRPRRHRLALCRARPAAGPAGRAGDSLEDALGGIAGWAGRGGPGRVRPRRRSSARPPRATPTTPRFCPRGCGCFAATGGCRAWFTGPSDRRFEAGTVAEAIDRAVRRSVVPDGQPQPGQRHAGADRSAAGGPSASGIRGRGSLAQRRRRGGLPGRADWGVAIEPVARAYRLAFLPFVHRALRFRRPGGSLGSSGGRRVPGRAADEPRHDAGWPKSASCST